MKEFFPEIAIRQEEAEAIARGLYSIARADGEIHPGELALISEFYAGSIDHPAGYGALERTEDVAAAELATFLVSEPVRLMFIKTALLMAHADGHFGAGEAAKIQEYATALGITADVVDDLHTRVKEFLLGQLAHLENVDAAAEVKRELDQ